MRLAFPLSSGLMLCAIFRSLVPSRLTTTLELHPLQGVTGDDAEAQQYQEATDHVQDNGPRIMAAGVDCYPSTDYS